MLCVVLLGMPFFRWVMYDREKYMLLQSCTCRAFERSILEHTGKKNNMSECKYKKRIT